VNARCTNCSEVFRVERPSPADEPEPSETLAEDPAAASVAEVDEGTEASEEEERTAHEAAEDAHRDDSLATEPPAEEVVAEGAPDASSEVASMDDSGEPSRVTQPEDIDHGWDSTPPEDDVAASDDPAPVEDDWVVEREPDGFMGTGPDLDPFESESEPEAPSDPDPDEESQVDVDEDVSAGDVDSDVDIESHSLESDSLTDDPFAIGGSPDSLDEPEVDREESGAEEAQPTFGRDGGMDPFGSADGEADDEEPDGYEVQDGLSDVALTSDEPAEESSDTGDALEDDPDGAEADEAAFGSLDRGTTGEATEATSGRELPGGAVPDAPTDGTVPGTLERPEEPVKAFSFGRRDPADKARRLARVLVSDMIMYNPERHQQALENDTLANDFEEEIKKSWKEYVEQVGEEMARETDYWTEALNDLLAKGEQVF